ncbi:MAG: sulfite exporter TauE/SafE family protein [Clostridiales bacterium]|jgi:uncharacterized membrane protein YfcA|nr:sulfite exporter TauE/SafE family protein [Clostridiales bacterium]
MQWWTFLIAGLSAGILSGMGMGGGTILIPILTLLLGVSQHAAQGINMLAFLPGALLAIGAHHKNGRIDKDAAKTMLPWGVAGAIGGALIATFLSAGWLKKAFGAFLCVLAVAQWRKVGKKDQAQSAGNLK